MCYKIEQRDNVNAVGFFVHLGHYITNFDMFKLTLNQVLLELARNRNKIPLPKSISGPGVALPPDQDTLISPNYQLAVPKKRPAQAVEEMEEDEETVEPNPPQEQKPTDIPQNTSQKVSFPLAKRTK